MLELASDLPAVVELVPGVCITLLIPVRVLPGYGGREIQAIINGLVLPDETAADQQKQWEIGVRSVLPTQTANYGTVLQPDETWAISADGL